MSHDPDAELAAAASVALARMVDAIRRNDLEAVAGTIGALLNAATRHARAAKPADEALLRAIERLNA